MDRPFLELVDVHKTHSNKVVALRGVDLRVTERQSLCIFGASGSGKTTLLAILGGVQDPTRGIVMAEGVPMSTEDRLSFRENRSTFIFRTSHLNENLSLRSNIEVGLTSTDELDEELISDLLAATGLTEKVDNKPRELSNLQRHFVVLVRAIASGRGLVLADEPTGELTSEESDRYVTLLIRLCERYKRTLVLATHNQEIAAMFGRTAVLVDGKIAKEMLVDNSMSFEMNLLAMSKLADALLAKSNPEELQALGLLTRSKDDFELTQEGYALAKLVLKWRSE